VSYKGPLCVTGPLYVSACSWGGVGGVGCRVSGLGFGVSGLETMVECSGFENDGLMFRVWELGFSVPGLEIMV